MDLVAEADAITMPEDQHLQPDKVTRAEPEASDLELTKQQEAEAEALP